VKKLTRHRQPMTGGDSAKPDWPKGGGVATMKAGLQHDIGVKKCNDNGSVM